MVEVSGGVPDLPLVRPPFPTRLTNRSFCDSDGDGWGDLKGIISKLGYLQDLGVDVVWLSPIFKSPQASSIPHSIKYRSDKQVDMGYDISDYKAVHGPYGTVQDVEELATQLHERNMKLMLDLVVNHTSDEHEWFTESRSSKTNPKRDWYFWRPGKIDENGKKQPPNNWKTALGGGSVWEYDEGTEEYYLHLYDPKQPGQFSCSSIH
jgi:oligo-1,6-glucosidase